MTSAFVQDPAFLCDGQVRTGKVDYAGIGLLALSLGLLQIVLDRGQRADWFSTYSLRHHLLGAVICTASPA